MDLQFAPIDTKDNSYLVIDTVDEKGYSVPVSAEDFQTLMLANEEYLAKLLELQREIEAKYQPLFVGGQPSTAAERSAIYKEVVKLHRWNSEAGNLFYT